MFDLAGVLLDFGGVESVARLSKGQTDLGTFDQFWSQSPWAEALYTGTCTPEAFAAGAVDELRLNATPAEFLREFQAWLRGPYPGAFELVGQLRRHAKVACLSNTNVLDVRRFRDELNLPGYFDACFFSNEIGHRKPSPASYLHVLGAFGLASLPDRALFFDDSPACVEGARKVGMQAHRVCGVGEVHSCLAALGIARSDGLWHGA